MNGTFVKTCLVILFTHCSLYSQEKDLKVVATASMISDIAYNVIGNLHEIETIVPVGGDPHLHEPTPRDAQLVSHADLILMNGLTFEGWITKLISNSGSNAEVLVVTQGVDALSSTVYQNSNDPHAWMIATNGIIYARNIRDIMKSIDPQNSDEYDKNFDRYESELLNLHNYIHEKINQIPEEKRILITSHDAFQYFGKGYGIRLEAIQGISTEAEAQTSDIVRVNKVIREYKVPAIFIESTINPKLIEQLAADNNIAIGGKLYADSLGDKDSGADTYIKMLRYVTDTIYDGLTTNKQSFEQKGTSYTLLMVMGLILVAGLVVVLYKLK